MWPYFGCGFHNNFLFWIVAILIVILIVRMSRSDGKSGNLQKDKSPIDILKERYAKGEITKEQFEQMKKDIE